MHWPETIHIFQTPMSKIDKDAITPVLQAITDLQKDKKEYHSKHEFYRDPPKFKSDLTNKNTEEVSEKIWNKIQLLFGDTRISMMKTPSDILYVLRRNSEHIQGLDRQWVVSYLAGKMNPINYTGLWQFY